MASTTLSRRGREGCEGPFIELVEAASHALSVDRLNAIALDFDQMARNQIHGLCTVLHHVAGAMPDAPGSGLFDRHDLEQWMVTQARNAEFVRAALEAADTARTCAEDKARGVV